MFQAQLSFPLTIEYPKLDGIHEDWWQELAIWEKWKKYVLSWDEAKKVEDEVLSHQV